jgi:hypothetical protein
VLPAGTWGNSSGGNEGAGPSSAAADEYNLLAVYDGHGGACRAKKFAYHCPSFVFSTGRRGKSATAALSRTRSLCSPFAVSRPFVPVAPKRPGHGGLCPARPPPPPGGRARAPADRGPPAPVGSRRGWGPPSGGCGRGGGRGS